jgi:hypothetical protein
MSRMMQIFKRWGMDILIEEMMMPKSVLVMCDGHFLPGRHHFVTR